MRKIRFLSDRVEYGFGQSVNKSRHRMMNRDGSSNIVRLGDKKSIINVYHSLVTMSWAHFIVLTLLFYLSLNVLFTSFYYFSDPDGISGMNFQNETDRIIEIFFFSAQSLTTVGYGRLNPSGHIASFIAAIESLSGLMGFAIITGLLYGRFSRPTAKLLFSSNALISPYKHERFPATDKGFMIRFANARHNQLLEVEAQLLFSYNDDLVRRFQVLNLELNKITFLTMSWTVVHPVDENSPLYGLTEEDLKSIDAEFLLNIKAMDETYAQQVYSRSSYKWDELIWNAKFIPLSTLAPDGRTAVDLRRINDFQRL